MSTQAWSSWNPLKPFGREKSEVVRVLKRVLDGSIDPREWGNFLDIPMKGTPELEAIRLACEALKDEERIDERGSVVYSPNARSKLRNLLTALNHDS